MLQAWCLISPAEMCLRGETYISPGASRCFCLLGYTCVTTSVWNPHLLWRSMWHICSPTPRIPMTVALQYLCKFTEMPAEVPPPFLACTICTYRNRPPDRSSSMQLRRNTAFKATLVRHKSARFPCQGYPCDRSFARPPCHLGNARFTGRHPIDGFHLA